ncbi:MAG TPA: DUF493 domain-containing protein [Halothiobacillus sp.]|nr:DUF493 domain-containing protein [Halothiobacillus sp.]
MTHSLPTCPLEGSDRKKLLTFPCLFPVKIMGKATETFEAQIRALVHEHVPGLTEEDFVVRASAKGSYLAITVKFEAQSQEQLDALYMALTSHPDVEMCL